jgi:HAD superfamily hydrolase (TIGR01509 family)
MIRAVLFDCLGVVVGTNGQRNEQLLQEIISLKKKYAVGMITSSSRSFLWQHFTPEELQQYFTDIVLADEIGAMKPQPEIYRLAAERLQVQPSECVFIDDHMGNVAGAEMVGMQGVLYVDITRLQDDLRVVLGQDHA